MLKNVKLNHKLRLQRICISFKVLIFLSIIMTIGSSILFPFFVDDYFPANLALTGEGLSVHLKLIYIGLDLISDISPVLFLVCLYKLFQGYQRADFFSETQVNLISYMALWLLMDSVVSFIGDTAKSGLLMTHNGNISFNMVFNTYQFTILGASLVCYIIGIVMQEGLAYKNECDLTV